MSKRKPLTLDEMNDEDVRIQRRDRRSVAFSVGSATDIREEWDEQPPDYEELLAIVRNLVEKAVEKAVA